MKRLAPHLPFFAALLGSVLYGMVPSLSIELYKNGMTAESILLTRYALGLCFIVPVALLRFRRTVSIPVKPAVTIYFSAAIIGTTYISLYFEALRHVPSSIAILIFFTYPALTLVAERIFFNMPIPPLKALAALLIVAGSGFAMGKFGAFTGSVQLGLLFACLAPLGYCIYLQIASRQLKKMSTWLGTLVIYAGLATGFLGVVGINGFHPPPNTSSWLLLLTIVVLGSVIPMAAFAYSMPKLGPSTYGIIASSELLTVVAIGVAFLGERLTVLQIGGAILVISGIVLSGLNFKSSLPRSARSAA